MTNRAASEDAARRSAMRRSISARASSASSIYYYARPWAWRKACYAWLGSTGPCWTTTGSAGDAPVLPALLSQIPVDERIVSVSGDGAYDTTSCHEAIALRAAHAIIPTRKSAKPWKANHCGADARNDILRATKRLGRAICKRSSGYHRRNLVETKMHCFKLLGERVMARNFDRQVAELQVRAAVLNRFTRLGTRLRSQCYKTSYK